ncbi:MAG: hypothetical protein RLZZ490_166 [Cyanobacteriota bacterium]|jgi:hypothetical protein
MMKSMINFYGIETRGNDLAYANSVYGGTPANYYFRIRR